MITLSSLSSRKDVFIEKLENLSNNIVEDFVKVIEKYVSLEGGEDVNLSRADLIKTSVVEGKAPIGRISELESDKKELLNHVKNLEDLIESYKKKLEQQDSENTELKIKIKDLKTELSISKNPEDTGANEYANTIHQITELHHIIDARDREIEGIYKEKELLEMQMTDEIAMYKENLETSSRKIENLKAALEDYDNVKAELKTQKTYYSQINLNEMQGSIDSKSKIIEQLRSEKILDLKRIGDLSEELKKKKDAERKLETTIKDLKKRFEELEKEKKEIAFTAQPSRDSFAVFV